MLTKKGVELAAYVFGPEALLLADVITGKVGADELNNVMGADSTNKRLLLLGDASTRIRRDMMGDQDLKEFDVTTFAPFYRAIAREIDVERQRGRSTPRPQHRLTERIDNAVVLSKLLLLDAATLNELVRDTGVWGEFTFGNELFEANGNVLTGALRSIDGDHQWREIAPLLPRQGQAKDTRGRAARRHGFGPPKGFRLWQSTKARNVTFHAIFKGPINSSLLDLWTGPCAPSIKVPFPNCDQ